MVGRLILEDKTIIEGLSFGYESATSGEIVFSTGMVGYPESLTDPSYNGQILVCTYPLIGNYGVSNKKYWESERIQVKGIIVSNYIDTPSHINSERTLSQWLKTEKIPALEIKDTRALTQKIREKGTMLAKIIFDGKDDQIEFYNPDLENLVTKVSTKKLQTDLASQDDALQKKETKTVVLIDCGAKENIRRELLARKVKVITIPWDYDPFALSSDLAGRQASDLRGLDAMIISNGPGNPKKADKTIATIRKALEKNVPILGICLGHQLLALAAGGDTKKLKYGHRSQNQPCIMEGSKRCFITTQNHGFEVSKIPKGFKTWFTNANDGSNEGIIHKSKPVMSVQFHPEARPGPTDCNWIFDYFLDRIKK